MTPLKSRVRNFLFALPFLLSALPAAAKPSGGKAAAPQAGVPAAKPDAKADDKKNPVNETIDRFKDKPAEMSPKAVEAFLQFIKADYADPAALKDGGEEQLKALIGGWVEESVKNKDKVGGVAQLFYVIDAKADSYGLLVREMKPWTGEPAPNSGDFALSKLKGTRVPEWTNDFLDAALLHADKVLRASNFDNDFYRRRVEADNKKPLVPGETGKPGKRPDFNVSKPDWEYLYLDGAEVLDLYQDGDKFSRTIAMKMVTRKDPGGKLVNEIRIYDITDPAMKDPPKPQPWDVFSQGFEIDPSAGSSTFQLDTRTPGKKKYTLTMSKTDDGDVKIVFSREGVVQGKEPQKGNQIETSANKLAQRRAEQAVRYGEIVTIDGKDFYSLGAASGGYGQLCYFPVSIKDKLTSTTRSELTPAAVANVTELVGGKSRPVSEKPDLGVINGKPYHMELHPEKFYWEIKPGPGDKPKPPSNGGGSGGDGGVVIKPPPDKPGTPDECDPTGGTTAGGYYVRNPGATQGAPKGSVCIYDLTKDGEAWLKGKNTTDIYLRTHMMVIPAAIHNNVYVPYQPRPDGKFKPGEPPTNVLKVGERFFMTTNSDGGVIYLDMAKYDPAENKGYVQIGSISLGDKKEVQGLAEKALLANALGKAGFSADQAKEAAANFAKVKLDEGSGYSITGSLGALVVTWNGGKNSQQFWPKLNAPEIKDPNHGETSAGNAYDNVPSGPFEPFKDDPVVDGSKLTLIKKTDSAAFYVNDVPEESATKEKPRRYYVIFGFVNHFGGDKKMRSKFIEIFSKGNGDILAYPTADVDIRGLMKHASDLDLMASGMNIRFLGERAHADKKGVYAGFATRAENPKGKKANCLGPIMWWGVTPEAAQALCEEGK